MKSTSSPTTIEIDFSGLRTCANTTARVGALARSAGASMDRSTISQDSFGLMNTALGAIVTPMASHARELTSTLAETASGLAEATKVLHREWSLVEEQASEITAKMTAILEDV